MTIRLFVDVKDEFKKKLSLHPKRFSMLFSSALCLILTAALSDQPHLFVQSSVKRDKKTGTGDIAVLYM